MGLSVPVPYLGYATGVAGTVWSPLRTVRRTNLPCSTETNGYKILDLLNVFRDLSDVNGYTKIVGLNYFVG